MVPTRILSVDDDDEHGMCAFVCVCVVGFVTRSRERVFATTTTG